MDSRRELRQLVYPSAQFAVFRVLLGIFLAAHFATLAPFGNEIYGRAGMFASSGLSPFPNILNHLTSSTQLDLFFYANTCAAILFASGILRRPVAVVLWYGWACLTNRTPFLYIPSEGLVGWLLLFSAVVPRGEFASLLPPSRSGWRLDSWYRSCAWIVIGVGYL